MKYKSFRLFLMTGVAFFYISCAGQDLSGLSSVLSQTGLMSGSQADSLLKFGSNVSKSTSGFTDEEEYYIGRGVAATILSKYKPYRNASVIEYVNKVAAAVVTFSSRPETFGGYHVLVLDTQEINAISAPGGFIFISRGFLKIIPDEDALAAVFAHEVGHVAMGHGIKAISQANLSQAFLELGKDEVAVQGSEVTQLLASTFGNSITDIANTLLTKGYGRSQELEADAYAARLLNDTGYNPQGLKVMLEQLDRESHNSSGGGWLSTHPSAKDRIEEVSGTLSKLSTSSKAQALRAERFRQAMKSLS